MPPLLPGQARARENTCSIPQAGVGLEGNGGRGQRLQGDSVTGAGARRYRHGRGASTREDTGVGQVLEGERHQGETSRGETSRRS